MAVLYRFPAQPQPYTVGTAVTAAALTSGLGGMAIPQIPGGIIQPGARLSMRAHFEVTSTSATPTVTVDFRFGPPGTAIGTELVLAASPALVINVAATAWAGTMVYNGTFRQLATAGAANGIIHGSGEVHSFFHASGGLAASALVFPMGITAAGRTVSTWNTSVAEQIDIGITLSSVTGTPSIVVTDFWGEVTG